MSSYSTTLDKPREQFPTKPSVSSNSRSWVGITLCALGIIVLVTGILTLCKEIPWHKVIRFPDDKMPKSYRIGIGASGITLGVLLSGGGIFLICRNKNDYSGFQKKNPSGLKTKSGSAGQYGAFTSKNFIPITYDIPKYRSKLKDTSTKALFVDYVAKRHSLSEVLNFLSAQKNMEWLNDMPCLQILVSLISRDTPWNELQGVIQKIGLSKNIYINHAILNIMEIFADNGPMMRNILDELKNSNLSDNPLSELCSFIEARLRKQAMTNDDVGEFLLKVFPDQNEDGMRDAVLKNLINSCKSREGKQIMLSNIKNQALANSLKLQWKI